MMCKIKKYIIKLLPHINFMIWFGFYYAGLIMILSFVATNIVTKIITIALWYYGLYMEKLSK